MSEKPSNSNSDPARSNPLSPGEILCRARKEKGLAAEEMIIHLGITQRTFNALEQDEYDLLPSPLYVKGYIKRYCSILGVSDTEALAGFDAEVNKLGLGNSREPVVRLDGQGNERAVGRVIGWNIIVPIVVIILLIIFAWMYFSGSNDDVAELSIADAQTIEPFSEAGSSGSDQQTITESQLENSDDLTQLKYTDVDGQLEIVQQTIAQQQIAQEESARQESTQRESIQQETIASIVIDKPMPMVSIAPDANVLQISVTQQSWIEILDAKGDILLADLKTSGYRGEVKGKVPFDVILGYAPGVKLTLNGKKVEIPSVGNDNTAKLKIGDKEEG